MSKTYKKNGRFKKDRRDQNFKKSKKFKEFNHGRFQSPKSNLPIIVDEPIEEIDDSINS